MFERFINSDYGGWAVVLSLIAIIVVLTGTLGGSCYKFSECQDGCSQLNDDQLKMECLQECK